MMETASLIGLMPHMILAGSALIILLMIAVKRLHFLTMAFSVIALLAAFISLHFILPVLPAEITRLVIVDRFAVFFMGLLILTGLVITFLSYDYFRVQKETMEEFYILLFLGVLGASVLVSANHFASFFLGFELLSISIYVMIAYLRTRGRSLEAGAKYLILAAASSAFLLFGMALVYSGTGSMQFGELSGLLQETQSLPVMVMPGFALMMAGFLFKLALVPFHMWIPDVYQGAPAPVTSFVATISKGAVFAAMFRFFVVLDLYRFGNVMLFVSIIAVLSMLTGNILALLQQNVKRLLAYSSIAHLGYLLVAFIAGNAFGAEAAAFYLAAYVITITGAFGMVAFTEDKEEEAGDMDWFRGLFWIKPWLSVIFTGMMLSLAGIPLTAGFLGKFYVAAAGIQNGTLGLVIILILSSLMGLYYYLRVVVQLFSVPPANPSIHHENPSREGKPFRIPFRSMLLFSLLLILLLWFGILPQALMELIGKFVGLPAA